MRFLIGNRLLATLFVIASGWVLLGLNETRAQIEAAKVVPLLTTDLLASHSSLLWGVLLVTQTESRFVLQEIPSPLQGFLLVMLGLSLTVFTCRAVPLWLSSTLMILPTLGIASWGFLSGRGDLYGEFTLLAFAAWIPQLALLAGVLLNFSPRLTPSVLSRMKSGELAGTIVGFWWSAFLLTALLFAGWTNTTWQFSIDRDASRLQVVEKSRMSTKSVDKSGPASAIVWTYQAGSYGYTSTWTWVLSTRKRSPPGPLSDASIDDGTLFLYREALRPSNSTPSDWVATNLDAVEASNQSSFLSLCRHIAALRGTDCEGVSKRPSARE